MSDKSKIEWTDATWNPVRGCSVVSEGCRNCYAMQVAARFSGEGQAYEGLAYRNESGAHWTGSVRLITEHLFDPLGWTRPRRIFVNSMSDLFHESLTIEQVAAVFEVMHRAPQHTFQILTKRPKRMLEFCTALVEAGAPNGIFWPFPNVWLGVSCEDQKTADERIPLLLQTPAAVRWISAEPLLGPIEASIYLSLENRGGLRADAGSLDWVVVGGESGPGARPMHPDWARSLRDQCVAANVPFFFKQWGQWGDGATFGILDYPRAKSHVFVTGTHKTFGGDVPVGIEMIRVGKKAAGRVLDGREWNEYPEAKAVMV